MLYWTEAGKLPVSALTCAGSYPGQDGGSDPHSAGVLVDVQGGVTRLADDEVPLTVLEYWTSQATGNR